MGFIKKKVKIEDVERDLQAHREKFAAGGIEYPPMIYYAVSSCWWTHNAEDLDRLPGGKLTINRPGGGEEEIESPGLPCDPRGSVLMQTDKPEEFLAAAKKNPSHYGRHGLDAFMAAHHDNCYLSRRDQRHWSFAGWDEYNDSIDNPTEGERNRFQTTRFA